MSTSRAVIAYVVVCVGAVIVAPMLGHVDVWWYVLAGASAVAVAVLIARRCWKAVTR
jgi:mannose-6-phosphate isomerase-like protein (cupin superfamily)